jgi:hypothetical protein
MADVPDFRVADARAARLDSDAADPVATAVAAALAVPYAGLARL